MSTAEERDRVAAQKITVTLGQRDRELVRLGISKLIDHYEKKLEKAAVEVHDFHIEACASGMCKRLMELRNRFADPSVPPDQIDAFSVDGTALEPDDRPLHLRLKEWGYEVPVEDIEKLWEDLDRENVRAYLDKLRALGVGDEEPAPPAVLAGYERAEDPAEPEPVE